MQLLPLISWIINTTASPGGPALPRGVTPYKVWFRRPPPKDFQEHKDSTRRTILGDRDRDIKEGSSDVKESKEDLFVNEHLEEEEVQEEMVLTELTKRVKEHMLKQQDNIVKKAGARASVFKA
jgi:hypothetical protein